MNISEQISNVWLNTLFIDSSLTAFTDNIYPTDVTKRIETKADLARLEHCDEINFIQFFVQSFKQPVIGRCERYQHRVSVEYYLEEDCRNENQIKIQSFFDELEKQIQPLLGSTWNNTLDHWFYPLTFPNIRYYGKIKEKIIYVGSTTYTGQTDK